MYSTMITQWNIIIKKSNVPHWHTITMMCDQVIHTFQLNRRPLHYAYAVSEDLVTLLLEHDADKDVEDAVSHSPQTHIQI